MKHLTEADLRSKNACHLQLKLFIKTFPNGVTLRSEAQAIRLAKSMADKFDFEWAAEKLLDAPAEAACRKAVAPARAAYEKAADTAWVAYEEAKATAWAAYKEAKAAAWAAYREVRASALAAYREAEAAALAAYKKAKAVAFATQYWRIK